MIRALVILLVATTGVSCVPGDISEARDLIDAGDFYKGSQAMDIAAKKRPNDPELATEAQLAKHAFLRDVLSRDVEPRLERIELAMRWITEGQTEPVEVQQYLLRRLSFAEETERWDMAIDTALTMKQPGRAARTASLHFPPEQAAIRLKTLTQKYPTDADVCEAYASFLGDNKEYAAAIKEYQRGLKLQDRTSDQSVIFKEQIAVLKKEAASEKGAKHVSGGKKHKK